MTIYIYIYLKMNTEVNTHTKCNPQATWPDDCV